ncbi:hypothetical protein JQT66_04850 [Sulfitobacter mediterraneus]|uniref:hypothetical protein n=1 Tax=Sulfitobacter mediterraneus TaxID=83219 RepID=UPI001931AF3D|nr:hypothetical protein [Sulfitobacter mediterraneus]MBM1309484.1 hypothetical protein [Sulfitobacter mediterraneus]MBM1313369.1 hypothetical protein [Sulfitobacter mediterraneus]MBM1321753.1 hypothetical protein [Sulfitobacter mediterraneus]MBM1325640.1 hypothetical protein [Sulfitobacter mediterraneus]MBM1396986.1 hypothetical protein [Sulfitobacter mediterraneus]
MSDPVVTEMANKLAEDCLAVQSETGEDRLFMEVSTVLGASSQTLEEAFLTAIRTRMANDKGRAFLAQKLKAHRAASGGS